MVFLEFLTLNLAQSAKAKPSSLFWRQRFHFEWHEIAVDTNKRRAIRFDMQIGALMENTRFK